MANTSNSVCRPSMFGLAGRTAIVTGAATGIGQAIAIRLADAGATIAVVDLNLLGAQQVAAALPNGSFAIEADVALADSVGRGVDQVMRQTGQIDILVNNAGMGAL
jgi:NAD(P)-dependent dehydrogenase (short-subunit alcohol dehydrogenase family)